MPAEFTRPPTLNEREVSDMIEDLRESEKVSGTCPQHSLVVRSAILGHRQSEQIQFGIDQINMQMQVLLKEKVEDDEGGIFGEIKYKKLKVTGMAAVIAAVLLGLCVLKWGPDIWNKPQPHHERQGKAEAVTQNVERMK